jgi:hypothetical protein
VAIPVSAEFPRDARGLRKMLHVVSKKNFHAVFSCRIYIYIYIYIYVYKYGITFKYTGWINKEQASIVLMSPSKQVSLTG